MTYVQDSHIGSANTRNNVPSLVTYDGLFCDELLVDAVERREEYLKVKRVGYRALEPDEPAVR